jgi:hypothetical protein
VQVSASEGVANHTVPESCAETREGFGEALTGVRIGWVLSRENNTLGRRHCALSGRQHGQARQRKRLDGPARS